MCACVWKASDLLCAIQGGEVEDKTGMEESRRESPHGPNPLLAAAWSLFTLLSFIMDDLSDAQSYDNLHLAINYQQTPPPISPRKLSSTVAIKPIY